MHGCRLLLSRCQFLLPYSASHQRNNTQTPQRKPLPINSPIHHCSILTTTIRQSSQRSSNMSQAACIGMSRHVQCSRAASTAAQRGGFAALRLLHRNNTQSLKHQGLQGCQQEFHRAHRSKATSPSTNPEQGASIRYLAKGFEFMIQSIKLTTSRNRTYEKHA